MSGLFGGTSPEIVKKWNLSSFISSDSPRVNSSTSSGKSLLPDLQLSDLNKATKQINLTMNKLLMEYDKLYRKFGLKSSDLRKYIKILLDRDDIGETLSALENSDINIIVNQMRILDQKAKIENDRLKQIRDEKKMHLDILKASGQAIDNSGINVALQQNSPLTISTALKTNNNPTTYSVPTGVNIIEPTKHLEQKAPSDLEGVMNTIVSENVRSEVAEAVPAEVVNTPINQPSEETLARMNSTVIAKDILGTETKTLNDMRNHTNDVMMERLKNKDNYMSQPTILSHDLNTSLVGMMMSKIRHTPVLFINVDNGTYYEKGYRVDEDGNLGEELSSNEFIGRGILHLGDLEFDILNKQVTTYYNDKPIPFKIVHSDDGMSSFYINEWNNPKTDRFRLNEEVLEKLRHMSN